jgi:hypothetical protein
MTESQVECEAMVLRYGFTFQQKIAGAKSGLETRYDMAWFWETHPHAHFLTLAYFSLATPQSVGIG